MTNMIGGVGYFHGQSLVSSDYTTKGPLQYWEAPLYTGKLAKYDWDFYQVKGNMTFAFVLWK